MFAVHPPPHHPNGWHGDGDMMVMPGGVGGDGSHSHSHGTSTGTHAMMDGWEHHSHPHMDLPPPENMPSMWMHGGQVIKGHGPIQQDGEWHHAHGHGHLHRRPSQDGGYVSAFSVSASHSPRCMSPTISANGSCTACTVASTPSTSCRSLPQSDASLSFPASCPSTAPTLSMTHAAGEYHQMRDVSRGSASSSSSCSADLEYSSSGSRSGSLSESEPSIPSPMGEYYETATPATTTFSPVVRQPQHVVARPLPPRNGIHPSHASSVGGDHGHDGCGCDVAMPSPQPGMNLGMTIGMLPPHQEAPTDTTFNASNAPSQPQTDGHTNDQSKQVDDESGQQGASTSNGSSSRRRSRATTTRATNNKGKSSSTRRRTNSSAAAGTSSSSGDSRAESSEEEDEEYEEKDEFDSPSSTTRGNGRHAGSKRKRASPPKTAAALKSSILAASATPSETADGEPLDKRARNKLSASAYRKRRKLYQQALESKVEELDLIILNKDEELERARKQNEALKKEVDALRKMMHVQSKKAAAATAMATPVTAVPAIATHGASHVHANGPRVGVRGGVGLGRLTNVATSAFLLALCCVLLLFGPSSLLDMENGGHEDVLTIPTIHSHAIGRRGRVLMSIEEDLAVALALPNYHGMDDDNGQAIEDTTIRLGMMNEAIDEIVSCIDLDDGSDCTKGGAMIHKELTPRSNLNYSIDTADDMNIASASSLSYKQHYRMDGAITPINEPISV